jgi:hypothetical protein
VEVEALGLATSGAAVSWMTLPDEVVVGEGVGFVASPAAVRDTMVDEVPDELEAGGMLFGSVAGVSAGALEEDVEVG